jgi:hypothetical protein
MKCNAKWRSVTQQEWTHLFVHTLDITSKNWYLELEVHRGIGYWEELTIKFKVTFNFESNNIIIQSAMQVLKTRSFATKCSMYTPRVTATIEEVLHFYNVAEENQEDEDLRNL